jgi:hypothetical protein
MSATRDNFLAPEIVAPWPAPKISKTDAKNKFYSAFA